MSPATLTQEDVQKRLEGKSGDDYLKELRSIATDMGEKIEANDEGVAVNLSPDQFERLFSGVLTETKKVAEEASQAIERKYDLSPNQARAMADDFLGKELASARRKQEENKIIGKRFAAVLKAQAGMFSGDEHKRACEEEAEYLKKQGIESRIGDQLNKENLAMSLGTDTTGGFLAPELWETRVYQGLAKTSYARRYATLIDMTGRELLRLPKMTGGLTAYTRDEATAGATSQPTFAQFTLQPKALMVTTNPISLELIEAGEPAVIELLTQDAIRAFGRKEDEAVFVGSDSQFTGLLESSTNVVTQAAGTTYAGVTFEDLFDLENTLPEQYTPDEDIQNSGGIDGQAMYWMNKSVATALKKLKGASSAYYWSPVDEMTREKNINGYPWKRVIDLPATTTTATKYMCFGNLKYVWIGYRPGIRTDLLKEGTVAGSNLATTAQYALRFIEFFDQSLIDSNAFSILRTA